jgi:peroxiredoxin
MLAVLGIAAAALSAGCRAPQPEWMQDGMKPPELSGATVDGTPVSLADAQGKVAVVFFFADWCPHCKAYYPHERELAKRMAGGEFVMIGVDADDTPDGIREAIKRESVTWPVIYDADARNAGAWGVSELPTSYVLDWTGVIRGYDLSGPNLVSTVDLLLKEKPPAH